MSVWPGSYPESCPPHDAEPSHEVFYRLVESAPPGEGDFWSHRELVAAGKQKARRNVDPCLAAGVSIFDSQGEAEKTRASVPALRDRLLATGSPSGSGVLKQTGHNKSHHTWWRPLLDEAWACFEVVV